MLSTSEAFRARATLWLVSPGTRVRVAQFALLAIGVAAGVVGYTLATRPRSHGGAGSESGSPAARAPMGKPMPAGCEVDRTNPPVLEFVGLDKGRLALGAFKQGDQIDRDVTVRNPGRGVLCIRDQETACGCVKATWRGDPHVPPSGSGTLSLHIDTTGRDGWQEKWVTLHSNDPNQHIGAVMTVTLDIRLGLVVEGGAVVTPLGFGLRAPGEASVATLHLRCPRDDSEWAILGVESLALPVSRRAKFTWALKRVNPEDPLFRRYDLHITHPGRTAFGHDNQLIRITTSHPERPDIQADADLTVVAK